MRVWNVWYRYFNDGDYFFRGYGKETAGSSATYLKNAGIPGLKEAINKAQKEAGKPYNEDEYSEKDGYLNNLKDAAKIIVEYVTSKKGKYEKNTESSR